MTGSPTLEESLFVRETQHGHNNNRSQHVHRPSLRQTGGHPGRQEPVLVSVQHPSGPRHDCRGRKGANEYNKNFVFKLEFRTSPDNKKNNSGIYIRGPQLQLDAVTEGGLTGVFRKLTKFKPGDWNEIEITVKGTEATCKCNGELIGKPMKVPEKGTIVQSAIGMFEFRRIRVKELP